MVVERDEERIKARPKKYQYLRIECYRQRAAIEVGEKLEEGGIIESRQKRTSRMREWSVLLNVPEISSKEWTK